jgi:DNA helicase-4
LDIKKEKMKDLEIKHWEEPRILAWLHGRRPNKLRLGSSALEVNVDSVALHSVQGAVLEESRWPLSYFSIKRVVVSYIRETTVECTTLAFRVEAANEITTAINSSVATRLSFLASEARAKIQAVECAVAGIYRTNRFVRFSQAKLLATRHKGMVDEAIQLLKVIGSNKKLVTLIAEHRELAKRVQNLMSYVDDWGNKRTQHNDAFIKHYRTFEKFYFDSVESSPLTDEQVTSSLVFEDCTLVVAAAGSGKSSCIVGKIGFALKTGLFSEHEILALAYNKAAAKELQSRLQEKLPDALGRPVRIASQTFHSFGLSVLLKHYGDGYKPKVLKEDEKEENRFIKTVISDLCNSSPEFQAAVAEWMLTAPYDDPQPFGLNGDLEDCARRYEECCRERIYIKRSIGRKFYEPSIPTYDPNLYVRSLQERNIANWLLLHKVDFKYEEADWEAAKRLNLPPKPSGKRPPYTPDFTYEIKSRMPDGSIKKHRIVHEHFALDASNRAPEFMGGEKYAAQAKQKREMYMQWESEFSSRSQDRVSFFETTSADFYNGSLFGKLRAALVKLGITIHAPDSNIQQQALQSFRDSKEFESLLISFVLSFKESGLSEAEVKDRASDSVNPYRAHLFLAVALKVFEAYQAALRTAGKIDFADMLRDAQRLLATKAVNIPYRFVLVDEFQDIARLKADLVKSVLEQSPDESVVFCVGDDWQTINRFAGSDISIFTGIGGYFNRHVGRVDLSKTFRCAQGIADVSRALVMRNRGQLNKRVVSSNRKTNEAVRLVLHPDQPHERQSALILELDRIELEAMELEDELAANLKLPAPDRLRIPSVKILRRTQTETTVPQGIDDEFLKTLAKKYQGRLSIEAMTMHSSKGLQADFVILPGIDSGRRGFPDVRPSEVLLDLVLPPLDDAMEEERRLFYVALTRARHQAVILAAGERPSEFVLELLQQSNESGALSVTNACEVARVPCPVCAKGSLIYPHPTFTTRSCSRRPMCTYREGKSV